MREKKPACGFFFYISHAVFFSRIWSFFSHAINFSHMWFRFFARESENPHAGFKNHMRKYKKCVFCVEMPTGSRVFKITCVFKKSHAVKYFRMRRNNWDWIIEYDAKSHAFFFITCDLFYRMRFFFPHHIRIMKTFKCVETKVTCVSFFPHAIN